MHKECPKCEFVDLGDQWVGPGRRLMQYCYACGWCGPRRVPEQKEIKTVKPIGGYNYEVFDCYGHLLISSQTYGTEKDAKAGLYSDLKRGLADKEAGPYKAVLWPASVQGELFK